MSKRDDILNATLNLVMDEGLHSLTFSKIFKKANVGSGTLYNYFKNMDELIYALYEICFQDLTDEVMKNYNYNTEVYPRFKHLIEGSLKYSLTYPDRMVFVTDLIYSSYMPERYRDTENNKIFSEILAVIKSGQVKGAIRQINPDLCISMIFGIIFFGVKGTLINRYSLDEYQISQIVDSCWKAIKI
ncbi:MAG: TetR/AcrR family transcriptional regulator [Fusobacteriaceae bacterium]